MPLQFRSLQKNWTGSAPREDLHRLHNSDRFSRASPAKKGKKKDVDVGEAASPQRSPLQAITSASGSEKKREVTRRRAADLRDGGSEVDARGRSIGAGSERWSRRI
jgi:hypothetical protein